MKKITKTNHFFTVFFVIIFFVIGIATKIAVDRIPEEHPVATWYYRTNTWLCDVDIDWKSFPITLKPYNMYTPLEESWDLYSYDFPNKINEESLLKDSKWHIHICVPLYGYVSE